MSPLRPKVCSPHPSCGHSNKSSSGPTAPKPAIAPSSDTRATTPISGHASTLGEIGDTIYVITINTDYHGEVKCRGIHSGVATVLSMAEVVSAHASAAILATSGSVTLFMGTSGAGKSLGATFWAERNDPTRRNELLRRYQMEKGGEKPALKLAASNDA